MPLLAPALVHDRNVEGLVRIGEAIEPLDAEHGGKERQQGIPFIDPANGGILGNQIIGNLAKNPGRAASARVVVGQVIAELFVAKGADVNARMKGGGFTSLDLAYLKEHTELADILREYGAKTGDKLKAEVK